ncbi:DUF6941 family protein [Comamonas kerstersii]|uniref:DUF6941 family protein n=1 Tax=Comamonas kerstersii TaxID=225992 RepID=UPI00266B7FEE|nr:hypothetical protein [Comamonas kerstersii]
MKQSSKSRYLHVLYAEDLRIEQNGTHSIIGVYPGGLKAQSFPVTLPKLAVLATLVCPSDDHFDSMSIEIVLGDKVMHRVSPPKEFLLNSQQESRIRAEKTNGDMAIELLMTFVAPKISQPGFITTRAIIDSTEVIEGNQLLIEEDQSDSTE